MPINLTYPALLDHFRELQDPQRLESASFLLWYLENYVRLDHDVAADLICDASGDRGVDGLYVDEDLQVIYVYQSRLSTKNTSIGDASLREFGGTLQQFRDHNTVNSLVETAGRAEASALLRRLNVADLVDTYKVTGVFLSNGELDGNGQAYLLTNPAIHFVGRQLLQETFISDEREAPQLTPKTFNLHGYAPTSYPVDSDTTATIVPIQARDLVQLDGIANQSIFTYNVRRSLGPTAVNRAIATSIKDPHRHKEFPLFHNGITIIANTITRQPDSLTIEDYCVINGCQSLISLHQNQGHLTDNLYILTKFIRVDPRSQLANDITEYSNNQNGRRPQDFMANSGVQIRLQNEMWNVYGNDFGYEIKRGEPSQATESISNEESGLCLWAFDLREPWATHRKYQVFDDKHSSLFSRPAVNVDRIVMLHLMKEVIDNEARPRIDNSLFGKHVLTRYFLMHVMRDIMDGDQIGRQVIEEPGIFVRSEEDRSRFIQCLGSILRGVIVDLNYELKDFGEDFDYRGRLREEEWIKEMTRKLVTEYRKEVDRGRILSFSEDWNSKE